MGYNTLLFLVILGFIFLVKKIPEIRGHVGEKKVSAFLSTLPSCEYKIFNDILLATESGTTQIDHIVVSRFGIFVIETKNYRGWITGNENGRAGICPQCGGNLVLRNGKYGSFYGCSHYPTCKFTKKI